MYESNKQHICYSNTVYYLQAISFHWVFLELLVHNITVQYHSLPEKEILMSMDSHTNDHCNLNLNKPLAYKKGFFFIYSFHDTVNIEFLYIAIFFKIKIQTLLPMNKYEQTGDFFL